MRRVYFTLAFALVALVASAAAPNGSGTYYQNANGKKGAALKTALCGIIYNHTEKSYDYLWTAFRTTDKRSDGKVWDMYSNITNFEFGTDQAGSYSQEGDVYNREHSFPKSWFGGEVMPMYTDLHHMYPTDGFVNNKRSNYPFGTTSGNKYKSANEFSKLGTCTYSGYTGIVFEPNDEYKGDFARTYFYMITCYEEKLADWYAGNADGVRATIDGSTYPGFQTWQLNMLLKWAKDDRVSDKEIARNTAVAGIQGNRNPFIDYPGLEQYIWGSCKDTEFNYNNYIQPTTWSTEYNDSGSGSGQGNESDYFTKITSTDDLESGGIYLIVYEAGGKAFDGSLTTLDAANNNISVTISDQKIEATQTIMASTFTITAKTGGYSVKSASGYYIGNTSKSNGLKSSTSDSFINEIAFNVQGNVYIRSNETYLYYNAGVDQSRFRYFTSTQQDIQLYKLVEVTSPSLTPSDLALSPTSLSFDLYNDSEAKTISYTTSSTGAVTVSSSQYVTTSVSGNTITVTPVKVTPSAQTITVSQAADGTYSAGSVTFTVTVDDSTPGPVSEGGYFTKVMSMAGFEVGGTYLIVYEGGSKALNGALEAPDVVGNGISVTISNDRIEASSSNMAATFIITEKAGGYSIRGTSGKYIGNNSSDNALKCSYSDLYTNSLQFDVSGNVYIKCEKDNNISYLRFNKAASENRFRYFKSSSYTSQQAIQLYKYVAPSHQTVTVSDVGYATYCSEYALDFGDTEITAYVGTLEGTALTFTPITQVPANTGLLLVASGGATANVPVIASASAVENNCLGGVNEQTTLNSNDYILNVKNGAAGFYKAGDYTTLAAHKAYIPAITGNGVKSFAICLEDDPTGISLTPALSSREGEIYNLAGQRIQKLQKGINIVNGKKILK